MWWCRLSATCTALPVMAVFSVSLFFISFFFALTLTSVLLFFPPFFAVFFVAAPAFRQD